MSGLLALLLGFGLGWALGRLRQGPARLVSRSADADRVPPPQLVAWMQEAPQGWMALDAQDTVQAINARAERLLRFPPDRRLRGVPLARLVPAPELAEAVLAARRHRRPQRVELSHADEPLEATLLPGSEGWMALWLSSRRSLESQLDQQNRWVSDVAHELKTPLTALLLVGDSLAAQATTTNVVLIERLQRELQRLQNLVSDLLELSRLEISLPQDESRYEVLDLAELVENVWSGLRPLAERRGIRLLFADRTPSLLWGDSSRLHRALLNLLDNALRYSPDGGQVEVSVRGSGLWWELIVRDHGSGFSDDDLAHMFERFYRGDPSRVRSERAGSGLGLAIVEQIALTHGGRVQGRNHPAGGAMVELVLPKGL
jgi:two-component system phosphate regulon sensor histidine kinase PhoR